MGRAIRRKNALCCRARILAYCSQATAYSEWGCQSMSLAELGSALLGRLGDSLGDQRYAQNVPNALMISKRKSLFMLHCIRELVVRFSCTRFFEPMRDTGAEILHKVLWGGGPDTNSQARVLDAKHFYPIDWRKTSWRNVSRRDRQLVHDEWLKPSSLLQAGLITEDSYTATVWTHGWKPWER